jgi:hypothetical protein
LVAAEGAALRLGYRCDGANLAYERCASLALGNAGSGRLEGGLMLC